MERDPSVAPAGRCRMRLYRPVGGCVGEAGVWAPVAFLTDAQAATYGCYSHRPSPAELDRSMHIRTGAHGHQVGAGRTL